MTAARTIKVDPSNEAAAKAWDGDDGAHWVQHAERYDQSVARYQQPFLDAAQIVATDRVLDIGCGNGQTTRDAAQRASGGEALGADVSSRLVANARRLARELGVANATFEQADAQVYPFEPHSFDVAISRFGAMFFGDPVAAFRNIGAALRPRGRLALLVWREPARNEWITNFQSALLAGREAPSPPPGAPGPFSLADPERVTTVLTAAGFTNVDLDGRREPMYFGRDADDAFGFVRTLGFTNYLLSELDGAAQAAALDALRRDIAAHETADGVHYDSATWIVTTQRA
jgi:SAM-dependent methyltransferase